MRTHREREREREREKQGQRSPRRFLYLGIFKSTGLLVKISSPFSNNVKVSLRYSTYVHVCVHCICVSVCMCAPVRFACAHVRARVCVYWWMWGILSSHDYGGCYINAAHLYADRSPCKYRRWCAYIYSDTQRMRKRWRWCTHTRTHWHTRTKTHTHTHYWDCSILIWDVNRSMGQVKEKDALTDRLLAVGDTATAFQIKDPRLQGLAHLHEQKVAPITRYKMLAI